MANDNTHIDWEIDQGGSIIHPNNTPGARLAALVKRTADWNDFGSSAIAVPWDAEEYDIGGWHDNATNNTRLTVPSGVSRVRLSANFSMDDGAGYPRFQFLKNGSTFPGSPVATDMATSAGDYINLNTSAEIAVTPGDYFEVQVIVSLGVTTRDIIASDYSWFFIRAVE